MANTVTKSGQVIGVVFDGASAFDLAAEIGASSTGVRLKKLVFYPAAANDVFTVRDKSATGPPIAKLKDTTGGGRDLDYHGLHCFPYVKGDEVPNGGLITFIIE